MDAADALPVDAGDPGAVPLAPSAPGPELAALRDRHLRLAADFENFRKRAAREVSDAERSATDDAVRAFLPILDNLERALAHAEGSPLAEGVGLVKRQFVDLLGQLDVRPFDTLGAVFSPALHDAVLRDERGDLPAGTVTREFQRGYKRGERVLRPASVAVAVAAVVR